MFCPAFNSLPLVSTPLHLESINGVISVGVLATLNGVTVRISNPKWRTYNKAKSYPKWRIRQNLTINVVLLIFCTNEATFQATLWGLSAPSILGELKAPKIRP